MSKIVHVPRQIHTSFGLVSVFSVSRIDPNTPYQKNITQTIKLNGKLVYHTDGIIASFGVGITQVENSGVKGAAEAIIAGHVENKLSLNHEQLTELAELANDKE